MKLYTLIERTDSYVIRCKAYDTKEDAREGMINRVKHIKESMRYGYSNPKSVKIRTEWRLDPVGPGVIPLLAPVHKDSNCVLISKDSISGSIILEIVETTKEES